VDSLTEIEDLVAHEKRGPGTDAERRAARDLVARLDDLGRDAVAETTIVRPYYALAHLIHAALAIAGGIIATAEPLAGLIVVLVTAVSAFGDLTGSFHLARRFTPRRASQNVVSRSDGDKPGRLVLTAHYDAGRGGAIFNPRARARRARIGNAILRRPVGPAEPFFWSIMIVLACCTIRLFNVDGLALNIVQFIPTIVLIVAIPLLADIALSETSPGASDNASGVATVLKLAERYGDRLEFFDVDVLLPGAGEGMQVGMAAYLKRHRKELDTETTVFLSVDDVGGGGGVRYATKEGWLLAYPYHPDIVALCGQIRDDDTKDGWYDAAPINTRTATDAHRARVAGFPAIAIGCADTPYYHQAGDTPENVDEQSLQRAYDFCSELIELIDERIGPQLTPGASRDEAAH
jgi:hypothetical protein